MPRTMIGGSTRPGQYRYLALSYLRFLTTGRVPAFPWAIHLQTQSRCNAACAMCPYPSVSKGWTHGKMSEEMFENIVDQLRKAPRGTTLTVAIHNEPLLNKDIFRWFRKLRDRAPQIRSSLTTNGVLLHAFSESEMEDASLDLLAVSLNAHTRKTYEQLNCGLEFDKVVDNILALAKNPRIASRLRVDFVETELNTGELDDAIRYWSSHGVKTYVKPLSNRAGSLDAYGRLSAGVKARTTHNSNLGLRTLRNRLGCPHPFHEMTILHNGDVILCCHDWEHSRSFGNVADSSIRAIWNGQALREVRRALVTGDTSALEPCNRCSLA